MIPGLAAILHAAAQPGGKTYADFVAHITALATGGLKQWDAFAPLTPGAYRTTAGGAFSSDMYGTIWSGYAFYYLPPGRLVRHGLPSEAVFNDQAANGRQLFFRLADAGSQSSFNAVNRNGYASLSLFPDPAEPAVTCTELIRWDGERAWKSNPSLASAETPYDWT